MKTKAVGFCKPMWEVLDVELSENSVAEQLFQSATMMLQKHRAKHEGIYAQEGTHKSVHSRLSHSHTWKPPRRPATGNVQQSVIITPMKYCRATNKKPHTTISMNLTDVKLSEKSQKSKGTYSMIIFIGSSRTGKTSRGGRNP